MRKLLSSLALLALTFVGLVSIASPASAVSPTANLFALNVANQNSGSGATNFYRFNGKVYFTASTLARGTALWSLDDGNYTKAPEFVFDPFEGSISGRIEKLWGSDHFLFFATQNTTNGAGNPVYVLDVNTGIVTPLAQQDSTNLVAVSFDDRANYVATDNGEIYIQSQVIEAGNTNAYGSQKRLLHFNKSDMTFTDLGTFPFDSTWAIWAEGNFIYAVSNPWLSWNDGENSKIYRFDAVNETWSAALTYADNTVIDHITVYGTVQFGGEQVLLFGNPTTINRSWRVDYTNYEFWSYKADGSLVKFTSWKHDTKNIGFFNFKNKLYVNETYNGEGLFAVDSVTANVTNITPQVFPNNGSSPIYFYYQTIVGDYLMMSVREKAQTNQGSMLYKWDGVNAAEQFSQLTPPTGQSNWDGSYSTSNVYTGGSMGVSGDRGIITLNRDSAIGAEPYYISLDGTLTLVKDMNVASEGSAPSTDCFISTAEGDWMSGSLPLQVAGGNGKSVIVSMKPEGSYLKYSVIDPGNILYPCAFTYVGADIYFQGTDPVDWSASIYKRTPDGTITAVRKLNNNWPIREDKGFKAFSYGGNYYWMASDYYNYDLYKYDIAADKVTYLGADSNIDWAAAQGKPMRRDEVRSYVNIGNKLVVMTASNEILLADLDLPEFTPVNAVTAANLDYSLQNIQNLTQYGNKVIFTADDSGNSRHQVVMQLDPATGELVKLFTVSSDPDANGWVNKLVVIGSKIYINCADDRTNKAELKKWSSGDFAGSLPLPDNFRFNCMAPTGGDLIIQGEDGKAYYYGNGLNFKQVDYDFSGNTYAFCNAAVTNHGTYLQLPEYPYDSAGTGFGQEPGYIGPLTPIAVSRLGETVNEPPAVPLSSTPPSEITPVAPGSPGAPVATTAPGKVNLTWTAPTTGDAVARYFVESTPAGAQCEITGTTAACIGLTEGINYTFTVTATNAGGLTTSSASNSVQAGPALSAPGPIAKPTVVGSPGTATVSWHAPTSGGAVESYIVQVSPNEGACVVTGTTAECTGLTDYNTYTFTVVAVNDADLTFSAPSDPTMVGDPANFPPFTTPAPTLVPGQNSMKVVINPAGSGPTATRWRVNMESDWDNYSCTVEAPATSCTIFGLDYSWDISYKAQVRAQNDNGRSGWSSFSDVSFPLEPTMPSTPAAPTLVAGSHRLTVNVPAEVEGGTPSYYQAILMPGEITCWINLPDTSCTFYDLDVDTQYTATVIAYNSAGNTDASPSSAAVNPAPDAPGNPGPIDVVIGNGKATVTPSAPEWGGPVSRYVITASPGGASCTVTLPATSCVITGLTNGQTYTFTSVAINAGGTSDASNETDEFTPFSLAPSTPGIAVIVADKNKVTVSPTAGVGGPEATSFKITASPGGAFCTVTLPATSCDITGLTKGVSYSFTTTALNEDGESEVGEPSDGVMLLANPPVKPGTASVVADKTKVTVTPSAGVGGGEASSFKITAAPGGAFCTVTLPATSCEITGLTKGVSYRFTTTALNEDGESEVSEASAAVMLLPDPPVKPRTATVLAGNGKVTVTPAAGVGGASVTSFKITATPGGAFCVVTLPATSCDITGLTNGTSYTFSTVATNSEGDSEASEATAAFSPVDPNADVTPPEGDGDIAPKGITGNGKFIATNDSTFQLAWTKATGKLVSQATGIYTGYIEAKVTFTKAGKVYTCTAQFGVLKAMPMKTAAQKAAAMKMKTFVGKQFCTDKTKLDPKTTSPKGGMTKANFVKIKPMNKSAAELKQEKAALTALKGFTGNVDVQIIRYRAWPTTMINYGDHTGKGGKIPALVRNTKVALN